MNDVNKNISYLDDFVIKGDTLVWAQRNSETAFIPLIIKVIKEEAFKSCSSLKSVVFPNGLNIIGEKAFEGCESLEEINLPSSINEINAYTFAGCKSLRTVFLPSDLTKLCEKAFYSCISLNSIKFPNTLKIIENGSFYNCKSLKKIELPKSLESIGSYAFSDCISLDSVEFSDNCILIEKGVFCDCTSLKRINLPSNIDEIKEFTFKNCRSLERIELPDSIKEIGAHAFSGCEMLMIINLPTSLKIIHPGAFSNCVSLKAIELPSGLRHIGKHAFDNCFELVDLNLPDGLKIIDSCAFDSCHTLKSIVIPKSVELIGDGAFGGCHGLESVKLYTSLSKIDSTVFDYCTKLNNITIEYESFSDLNLFILNNHNFFRTLGGMPYLAKNKEYIKLNKIKKPTLVFDGPELTIVQQRTIKGLLKCNSAFKRDFDITFLFENKEEVKKEEIDEEYDKDILLAVEKIKGICSYLPEETKVSIIDEINRLISSYKQDLNMLKPRFNNLNNNTFEFGQTKDIKTLKPNLLMKLESIYLELTTLNETIKFLEKLNNYKMIVNDKINDESNDNSLEGDIRNIIYYSNYLDDENKKEVIDRLNKKIDETISLITKDINNRITKKEHFLLASVNYTMKFRLDIKKIYDEVVIKSKKLKPYKILLNCLNNDKEEYINSNNIGDMISSIRFVITKLTSGTYKNYINKELSILIEKYVSLIKSAINDENKLDSLVYEEIEQDLRNDLNSLLNVINKYIMLDSYHYNMANKKNLLNQLQLSIDIIDRKEITQLDDETRIQPITKYVIEINNMLILNYNIDASSKEEIKSELLKILDDGINSLTTINIDTLEDYNNIVYSIIKSLAGLELSINLYIKNILDYRTFSKKVL